MIEKVLFGKQLREQVSGKEMAPGVSSPPFSQSDSLESWQENPPKIGLLLKMALPSAVSPGHWQLPKGLLRSSGLEAAKVRKVPSPTAPEFTVD